MSHLDDFAWKVDGALYGAVRVQPSLAAFIRRDPCPWIVWRKYGSVRGPGRVLAECTTEEAARAALSLVTGGVSEGK